MAHSTPRFLQGTYAIEGKGLDKPDLLDDALPAPAHPAGESALAYRRLPPRHRRHLMAERVGALARRRARQHPRLPVEVDQLAEPHVLEHGQAHHPAQVAAAVRKVHRFAAELAALAGKEDGRSPGGEE